LRLGDLTLRKPHYQTGLPGPVNSLRKQLFGCVNQPQQNLQIQRGVASKISRYRQNCRALAARYRVAILTVRAPAIVASLRGDREM
jgi:hypothetical protein